MPPAFVLSQDQTLKLNSPSPEGRRKVRELSFAQIFGLTKRCTNTDRSYGAESTQRPPPAHPFYVYLQCQRARSKSKKGNPPPAKEPPAVNFRERGSTRPRNRCQTLKIRRSHYIPKSQKKQQILRFGGRIPGVETGRWAAASQPGGVHQPPRIRTCATSKIRDTFSPSAKTGRPAWWVSSTRNTWPPDWTL